LKILLDILGLILHITNQLIKEFFLKKLKRYRVGELPLIYEIAQRINLRDILYEFIPLQANEGMPAVETLMLLIYNLTTGKFPLYELDAWVKELNLGVIGLESYREAVNFTDDRFGRFLKVEINKVSVLKTKKRKGKVIETKTVKTEYTLSWGRNDKALKEERNVDGVFPILTTDPNISAKEALIAYKYQPNLEKRFSQFKSIHNAAPIFLKKIERVEANMFLFFIGLILQALVEREVRSKMTEYKLEYLNVYPESREAVHPTTSKTCDRFSQISTYEVVEDNVVIERYQDELSELHLSILEMLGQVQNIGKA
jgi:hypothetical protein